MIDQGSALTRRDPQIRRAPNSAGLYDILDLILDKGLVIDAFVRVSLVGIELLTVDLRVVVASVDTYLRYAEGAERLQLYNRSDAKRLGDIASSAVKGKSITSGIEKAGKVLTGDGHQGEEEEQDEKEQNPDRGEGFTGKITKGVRNVVGKLVDTVTGGDEDDEDQDQGQDPDKGRQRQPERQQQRGNGNAGRAKAGAGARR